MSIPHIAAEKSPTGESTLKRPPTPSGTGRARYPSRLQICRIVPLAGSVMATMLRAKLAPRARWSSERMIMNWAAVSAVSPDLLMTLKSVRSSPPGIDWQ